MTRPKWKHPLGSREWHEEVEDWHFLQELWRGARQV
jgi:hypothetical protein